MKKNQIITAIIVLVLVGGLSFYAGTKVGAGNSGPKGGQFGAAGFNGMGGPGGANSGMRSAQRGQGGMMGGFVTGEVLSKDATSVTVKLKDGGSKIIFVTAGTAVQKTVTGSIADVVVGTQITANGQANADGSINATSIQQRPNTPVQGATQSQGGVQGGVPAR